MPVLRMQIVGKRRQARVVYRQIEQRDFFGIGLPYRAGWQQRAHGLIEADRSLYDELGQRERRECLGDGADFKDRIRLRGSVREHALPAAFPDSDGDAASGARCECADAQRGCEVLSEHRFETRSADWRHGRVVADGRSNRRFVSIVEVQGPDKSGEDVQRGYGDTQCRRDRGYFGEENGAGPDGQWRKHHHVAPVWKRRIPGQDCEEADHEHRRGNHEVHAAPLENEARSPDKSSH